jgi:hypothetical protein
MLVGVCLRVCVSVCAGWCLQIDRAAHRAGAGEPAPRGGLAQTVMSLAPGAARRPPGGLGIGVDDLPTTNRRRTKHVDMTLLAMCGATYCLITVEKDRVTLSCAPRLSRSVLSLLGEKAFN